MIEIIDRELLGGLVEHRPGKPDQPLGLDVTLGGVVRKHSHRREIIASPLFNVQYIGWLTWATRCAHAGWILLRFLRAILSSFAWRKVIRRKILRSMPMSPGPISQTSRAGRSEEHTSELQSLMRISYAVFCLKKKKKQ